MENQAHTPSLSSDLAQDSLYKIRHSLAHVLAKAVLELRPGTKLGFGPPIEDGFYYDFILSAPLSEADFPEIEKAMRRILQKGLTFDREDLSPEEAFARIHEMGEPYKREYAQELCEKRGVQSLSFYRTGDFVDMCEGPHVASTKEIPSHCFELRSIAGAYWRGNSKNTMMTRIYAWCFASQSELKAHLQAYAQAQTRDHKKLAKELEIFTIDETVGKGLPLWLPNGTVLRMELEKLMTELEFKAGYRRVATPHLARAELYYQTGHLPYYAAHMYPLMELHEERHVDSEPSPEASTEAYCLKPMNCPHHHKIYASRPRSYRELPLRLAEYGQVYRFEDSGALSGLLRVRGMCMNDAHIYCTQEQIKSEFLSVMQLHREVYEILGLNSYHLRFSTWDPEDPQGKQKYVNQPEAWAWSQKVVYEAMRESGLPFTEGRGEAAFYGPKIDIQFKTVTGREETASTNQLDFAVPERLDLRYVGSDNQEHRPYIIHRAPLGTHERFVAFLLEHYGGAFPTWLAPVQAQVITVSEKFDAYAEKVVAQLRSRMIRAEMEYSSETLGKKIRTATKAKVPNIFIIGEKEQLEGTLTLRRYGRETQHTRSVEDFEKWLLEEIRTRRLPQEHLS